jgi:hypothetical protein
MWTFEYPHTAAANATDLVDWANKAFWHDNFFTQALGYDELATMRWDMFGTGSKSARHAHWASHPNHSEIERQNRLGRESPWLRSAIARLRGAPLFGVFDRMPETFELLSYYLCVRVPPQQLEVFRTKVTDPRASDPRLLRLVSERHRLDTLLSQEGEVLFDEMCAHSDFKPCAGDADGC